jgi:hypothetical protein
MLKVAIPLGQNAEFGMTVLAGGLYIVVFLSGVEGSLPPDECLG